MPIGWTTVAAAAAAAASTLGACHWQQQCVAAEALAAEAQQAAAALREGEAAREVELERLREEARRGEKELERLRKTNRQLAQGHQALAAIPAPLRVPAEPQSRQLPSAEPSAGVLRLQAELERRHKGGKRRAKRREPLASECAKSSGGLSTKT